MTPTTLTGEWHVAEVEAWDCYPSAAPHSSNDELYNFVAENDWASVIAYADKHAPTDH